MAFSSGTVLALGELGKHFSAQWSEWNFTVCFFHPITGLWSLSHGSPRMIGAFPIVMQCVTLGLSRNRSVRKIKVIRLLSIIHSRIILDLVCGFGGSVHEDVGADFPSVGARNLFRLSEDSWREKR